LDGLSSYITQKELKTWAFATNCRSTRSLLILNPRRGAELADQIAAFIPRLDSLEEHLIEALQYTDVPANPICGSTQCSNSSRWEGKIWTQVSDLRSPSLLLLWNVSSMGYWCTFCLVTCLSWFSFFYVLMAFAFVTN